MNKTRKRYIALLIVSLMLGVITGGEFPYLIFTILFINLLYSYYSLYKAEKNLYHFFWVSNDVVKVGDSIEIGYKLNNIGFLPIAYVEVECNISKRLGNMAFPTQTIFFKPFEIVSVKEKFKCRHRGFYSLGELNIRIRDFLNIFEKHIVFNKDIDLIVYPRIYEINEINIPAAEFFGKLRTSYNTHEDYTSIRNIREYTEGDSVKKIHWKITAKLNDVYIKEFELSANSKINIIIDGYENNFIEDHDGEIEERMIEVAASIINYCLKNNLETTLTTNITQRRYLEGRSLDKLDIFLKELIAFVPKSKIPLHEILVIESRKLFYGSTLVILTTKLDKDLFDIFISLRDKRFNLIVVLIKNDGFMEDEELREHYLKSIGIDIYTVMLHSDIREVLEVCR